MILTGVTILGFDVGLWLNNLFHKIMLLIDGSIYWAVSQAYQIFLKLASARIFEDAFFSNFAKRIYAILGVVMLFYLAYVLLNAVVDPDKMTQGDKGLPKLAQNIVVSLVILGLLPILFDYAYKLQGIIFKENVIGAIVFGSGGANDDATLSQYGNYMAYSVLNPFLNPGNYNVNLASNYSWFNLKQDLLENGEFSKLPMLADATTEAQPLISDAADATTGTMVKLDYKIPIPTVCGVILLYIIASFCLDLGVRIIKFAFCQLIAPIPIVMRMIPSKKGVFDKWLKLTLTVYFEVFIRVGIMYMVVYFFSELANLEIFQYAKGGIQGLVVLAIILMGLLVFAKQAPKMIGEMLGMDSGNIKLGIKDKLKAGGFFAAGAAVGAGTTGIVRNAIYSGKKGFTNVKDASGVWNKSKAIVGGVLGTGTSILAGGTSGLVHSFGAGRKAGNWKEMKEAASAGAKASLDNRTKREVYKANHDKEIPLVGKVPVIGKWLGEQSATLRGHATDGLESVKSWAGLTQSLEQLKSVETLINAAKDANKSLKDTTKFIRENVEKNDRNVTFTFEDANGVTHNGVKANLAVLLKEQQLMETTGKDSTGRTVTGKDLTSMQRAVAAAQKQADQDIRNGLKQDGSGKRISADKVDAQLKADLTKVLTTTRAAANAMKGNISIHTTEFERAKSFADTNFDKDAASLILDPGVDVNGLVNDLNKSVLEAQGNVNTKINKFYEDQSKKGK